MKTMELRHRGVFTTITTEGGLLPADLLQRLAAGDGEIAGLTAESYHLSGEKLNEAISRSWNRMVGAWAAFDAAFKNLPDKDLATSLTRERWLLPLFQELGYGRLTTRKAVELGGKSYPISHMWEHTPIHLVGWRIELDRRAPGVAGAARLSPHGMMQEFLNRSDDHLWAFLSNGRRLRVLRDNVSLTRQAYVDFDLEAIMAGEVYSDFVVLWLLCHQSRVEADQAVDNWLERWTGFAAEQGTRALEVLRRGVEQAIESLGRGFLSYQGNQELRDELREGQTSAQDYYRCLLRLVYRMIFLFVAEDRGLLADPSADPAARERYANFYSTARLRRLAMQRRGSRHTDLYETLRLVMKKLGVDDGCPQLALPALGSFLWSLNAIGPLQEYAISNMGLLEAIRALACTVHEGTLRTVDYKNLGAEELGSVYESLLELHPELNTETATFSLKTAAGHERKTTGSYYTPTSLIQSLLDTALEPALEKATRSKKPEDSILDLKVCDPACGSGHFLIAAANRIARRLAACRTGEDEPSPEETRKALRDAIGRCIYGVDVNPMAVELCKVALWMETLEPGRPLSFLDHRILCGNSLLGTNESLIAEGIPDRAFKPITGDEKDVCASLRRQNKAEREGLQRTLFTQFIAESSEAYLNMATELNQITTLEDGSIGAVKRKEQSLKKIVLSEEYKKAKLISDAWCSAFVWTKAVNATPALTHDAFLTLRDDPSRVSQSVIDEVVRLSEQYQFFHWHLAFPDVFQTAANERASEGNGDNARGGFDVVLGNPPWERIQVEEKQFFSDTRPDIASARSRDRKRMIEALQEEDPKLYLSWMEACRIGVGQSHFVKNSGLYPLSGFGNVNTFALFVEGSAARLNESGYLGMIVPSGLITEAGNQDLFRSWMEARQIVKAIDFENTKRLFPEVDSRFRFCLLTLCAGGHDTKLTIFHFFIRDLSELGDSNRAIDLSLEDILRINPSSATCPPVRTKRDADILLRAHDTFAVLGTESVEPQESWQVDSKQMLNSSHDSNCFIEPDEGILARVDRAGRSKQRDDGLLRLYDGKMIDQFNHRLASTGYRRNVTFRTTSSKPTTLQEYGDPFHLVLPQYWVPEEKVRKIMPDYVFSRGWLIAFRAVTAPTNWRTLVAAVVPLCGLVHSAPAVYSPLSGTDQALLLALLNSYALDYCIRLKLTGTHLSHFVFKQLPIPSLKQLHNSNLITRKVMRPEDIYSRVLELTFTAWDVAPFARECGYNGPPFEWDEERRFLLRCELDAAAFHIYGMNRDDVDYMLDGFPIVKRKEDKALGEYRTKRVILEVYDAMSRAFQEKTPFGSALSPLPGYSDRSIS